MDVVRDDTAYPEVLWTFYSDTPKIGEPLYSQLAPGIDRGRVTLYAGVDCNHFVPKLLKAWQTAEPGTPRPHLVRSNSVHVAARYRDQVLTPPSKHTVLEGDDEDRPPVVDICVGRDRELQAVKTSTAKVVFLTGMGGQGKSTLAARYFNDSHADPNSFSFYVWRDCKEESERFETQLASIVERLSDRQLSGATLAKQSPAAISEVLVGLIENVSTLFVFDNADHYVNLETYKPTGSVAIFIDAILRSRSKARVIFTCRPSITYDGPSVLSCRLEEIDLQATLRLFAQRGATSSPLEIEDAHRLTNGHAFWLDLMAIQVAKRTPAVTLPSLVEEIRSGRGPLPESTLNSIWSTLRDRERAVLRAMAETLKPDTEIEIGDYLSHELNYNRVIKALTTLRALNLVVVKRHTAGHDLLELHPVVRQFIRSRFPRDEQVSYLDGILRIYRKFIEAHKTLLSERPSLSILQHWTEHAELDIAACRFDDAFATLAEVAAVFYVSAYTREYSRTGRLLLAKVDWVVEHAKYRGFEWVLKAQVVILSHLGEYNEVDGLLDQYERTVAERDARYVRFCDMKCQALWIRGDFSGALSWGKVGHELITSSGVDTAYEGEHNLALAERDSGRPELALPAFLAGRSLAEVLDPEELDEELGGAYYGNVGRCLHFMGQIDGALVCYQKSALLIERDPSREHVMNQGYIRSWIGELLLAREQFSLAGLFFRAAYLKWEHVSPPKAARARVLSERAEAQIPDTSGNDEFDAEQICLDWILGHNLDSQFAERRR